ncbi:MAG: XdhC family protein [Candidatus Krumholzibacteria bacterium]|nr:XdhC family protein [Candidatus Krumholzibacteria bacterium]
MNFSLLDSILAAEKGVLATITGARGHTYKKIGHQALYVPGRIEPVHGNLGALCADQEILARVETALAEVKPGVLTVDSSDEADALVGTGSGCGGTIELLLEPVLDAHKQIYARLDSHLADGPPVFLVHEVESGDLRIEEREPAKATTRYVERVKPLTPLYLFGATPLARRLVSLAAEMDFVVHLVDWREAFLDLFRGIPRLRLHLESADPPAHACTVILSHGFERDLGALRAALLAGCRYVGVLSSRGRRERMFAVLTDEGFSQDKLEGVHSPIGLDIGARSDPEIAMSIMAEIVAHLKS